MNRVVLNNKLFVKILAIILMLCVVICAMQSTFLNLVYAEGLSYDDTNVLDDLKSSTINGEPFNIKDYPYNENANLQLINVVEYCYSYKANMQANYGIYLYIYNPQGLNIIDKSLSNKVQIQVKDHYEKLNLIFCNKSEVAQYKGLFYKYKVDGANKFLEQLNSNEREYKISGIELFINGDKNAREFKVGGIYKFSGYSKGYGPDSQSESSLVCVSEELETLELIVHHSTFRTSVSSKGANHYNQVSTAYFSVPDYIFKRYGNLQKIRAEWFEYLLKEALITSNNDVYEGFKEYTTKTIEKEDESVKARLYTKHTHIDNSTSYQINTLDGYEWAYNIKDGVDSGIGYIYQVEVENRAKIIPYVFKADTSNLDSVFSFLNKNAMEDISSNEVLSYMMAYKNADYGYIQVNGRTLSSALFEDYVDEGRKRGFNDVTIDLGDTFNLLSYDSNHSWWDKLLDYGIKSVETGGDYYNVAPIYEIKSGDFTGSTENVCNNLLINKEDLSELKTYYLEESAKGNHVILFRFANTDYYSETVNGAVKGVSFSKDSSEAYIAQETVFLDFDIIELTFSKDGDEYIIPVVSSPIDVIGGFTAPEEGTDWWKPIVTVLLGLVFLILLIPILPHLIKLVIWIVLLPFKLIVGLFKLFKRKRNGGN